MGVGRGVATEQTSAPHLPLVEALVAHAARKPVALHVPGHKMGRGAPASIASWFGSSLQLDVTELPNLDELHHPEGVIGEAQRLAAQAFGADHTFFLVGGSTCGNLAMLLGACKRGDTILVGRNAHMSVWNGLLMAGLCPVWLQPSTLVPPFAVPSITTVQEVAAAIQENPHARAVFITSPTYHGICSDLSSIAKAAHDAGMLLLVDEAHGAHFAFHELLPRTAMSAGADACVQSTHKMLGSLTQSAMLHVREKRVAIPRIQQALRMVQSSSPSYLLMASLDGARAQMQEKGYSMLDQALRAVASVRAELGDIPGATVFEPARMGGSYVHDPFKLWIAVDGGWTGAMFAGRLQQEHRMYVEWAGGDHLLAVWSYADGERQASQLIRAVREVAAIATSGQAVEGSGVTRGHAQREPLLGQRRMKRPGMDVLLSDSEEVPLASARGRAAADLIVPYPPGIPIIGVGEIYDDDILDWLRWACVHGVSIQGGFEPQRGTVRVIRE